MLLEVFNNILWLLTIGTILINTDSSYDADNYNGWMPITNHQALNIPISATDSDNYKYLTNDAIKIVTPQPVLFEQDVSAFPETFRNIKIVNEFNCYLNGVKMCSNKIEDTKAQVENTSQPDLFNPYKTVRRAKKLVDDDVKSEDSSATDSSSNSLREEHTAKQYNTPTEVIRNVYEVTEDSESADTEAEESERTKDLGYVYDSHTIFNSPEKINYVSLLTDKLRKYNIDDNINLQNYDNSKQIRNIKNFVPNQINKPLGFNSLNHLPVNPLLAVFLSNYGHYLPGVYGAEGGYKNLYGYLASNNIHNNRPFGLYKITSDTDSLSLI